jgi:hypothetical protein
MIMHDFIGKRGEVIFTNIISRNTDPLRFLFDPTFMGEKFSGVDFYVGLNYTLKKGFFLASIKATTLGYSADGTRIKIVVDKEEIDLLSKFQAPVYLFGIDAIHEKGYFINANKLDKSKNLNGIPVKYPINSEHMELLWMEVKTYWDNNREITKFISHFN